MGGRNEKEKAPSGPRASDTSGNAMTGSIPTEILQQANAIASHVNDGSHETHGADVASPIENLPPPPPYSESAASEIGIDEDGTSTGARVGNDGRVDIKIDHLNRRLTRMLTRQLTIQEDRPESEPQIPPGLGDTSGLPCPPLNVVIQVVGSRGDVQPFVALGQVLKNKYNHRVRLATHPVFRDFVTENGLEFFDIGGDPADLMAFMVKNPGLIPGMETLKSGEIGKKRRTIYEMMVGCWRSSIEPGDGSGPPVSDDNVSSITSIDDIISMNDPSQRPFVADAIIANPPSFAHIHIAEKLGIPLHLMFTMPWSPTQAYPHPLANIMSNNTDIPMANYLSYILVDMLTWNGTGDVFNRFREKTLRLEPMSVVWAPGGIHRLRIPWTYAWSPALIPKPVDWPSFIDIAGFFFLDLGSNYVPAADLAQFLAAGPPPVYIGFGSIVVDDPNKMTKMIFEAVKLTGQRALVSKGWGGLSADELGLPDGVFMLGNCPHDWLFERVSAVVHHGGAGTTAAGVKAGRPTVVVPFFGDQPFWGHMVNQAGAGPKPIAYKDLTAQTLADSILEALKPESLRKAGELSARIKNESGPDQGATSFHKYLQTESLRCSITPGRAAVWRIRKTDIRLSALTATVLANAGLIDFADLKLYRHREYDVDTGPPEPISGGAAAIMGTIGGMTAGIADFPSEVLRSIRSASGDADRRRDQRQNHEHPAAFPSDGTSTSDLSSPAGHDESKPSSAVIESNGNGASTANTTAETDDQAERSRPESVTTSTPPAEPLKTQDTIGSTGSQSAVDRLQRDPATRQSLADRIHHKVASQDAGRITIESAVGSAKAASHIVGIGLKSPLDFTMSLAKGFHNIPRLYNDKTIRPTEKVTGFHSGLRAAGKTFAYGFMDGVGGLVTQPYQGFREEGSAGFVKGLVKGSLGLVVKPGAAIWGLPAYTMQGIYAEISKNFGKSTTNYIIAARMAQGLEDFRNSGEGERERIVATWKLGDFQHQMQQKKHTREQRNASPPSPKLSSSESDRLVDENGELLTGFRNTKHLNWDERKELARRKKEQQQNVHLSVAQPTNSTPSPPPSSQPIDLATASEDEFRDAIRTAIERTSTNNSRQDQAIESAIWASVRELRRPQPEDSKRTVRELGENDEDDAYTRAVAASVADYKRSQRLLVPEQDSGTVSTSEQPSGDNHFDEELTRAITASLEEYSRGTTQVSSRENHTPSPDTEEDEDYKRAIQESMLSQASSNPSTMGTEKSTVASSSHAPPNYESIDDDDEAQLQEALRLSELDSKERETRLQKQRTEEDIVMEYIKKQSLQEEEYRQKMAGKSVER